MLLPKCHYLHLFIQCLNKSSLATYYNGAWTTEFSVFLMNTEARDPYVVSTRNSDLGTKHREIKLKAWSLAVWK